MAHDDSTREPEELDFTIARNVSRAGLIGSLEKYFGERTPGPLEVDRETLNSSAAGDFHLSKSDAECLFTGLELNGAASQSKSGRSFADYRFTVDTGRAVGVLETQRVARAALEAVGALRTGSRERPVELTGTFPPGIPIASLSGVRPLSDDLRRMFFDADSVVRIANPYFDPSPSVVGDLASLADRGVNTRILTRETDSASRNLRSALNTIYEEIEPTNRHHLKVRDLFEEDGATGKQTYATHAKIAIADTEVCYLGSANLTDTSLSSNFELGVLLRGEAVETAIDVFDVVFDFSSRVELPI